MKRVFCALLLALSLGTQAGALIRTDGQTLRFEEDDRVVWERTFPRELGALVGPVTLEGNSYVGVGPVVYAFSPQGKVLGRADLPGPVTTLDSSGRAVRVTVGSGPLTERFTLEDPTGETLPVQERVVLPPDPRVTFWLPRFADSLTASALRDAGEQFPGNPFIALREAQVANRRGNDYEALSNVRRALGSTMPFPAWTELASRLDSAGFPTAANLALERAKRDAAARGIDPAVPVSREALNAYGNPSGYVSTLLDQNRLARAEVWMNFVRELYPRSEGSDALYRRYAGILEAQGRAGEAEEWRQFARSLRAGTLYNLGPQDTSVLRDAARLATFALTLALVAAMLTLSARAWATQHQDVQALGGHWRSWRRPLDRLRLGALNYASFSERLMLVLLSVALFTALGSWQWANQTGQALRTPALNVGTYGGAWSRAQLGTVGLSTLNQRPNPATYLLAGLTAQLEGNAAEARTLYTRAGQDACALNNLGAIAQSRDDAPQARQLYQQALALQPDLSAAAYNLGRNPAAPETTFQRTYRSGEPRLCYPDRRTLARTVSGDVGGVLSRVLTDPLGFLADRRPRTGLDWAMLGTLLLLGLLLVILLTPRAANDARLGRPLPYRLLSLLLPGTGLLGNAWGGVLLAVWGGVCIALLGQAALAPLAFGTLPGLQTAASRTSLWGALLGLYLLNALAVGLIEAAHARRKRRAELRL